MTYSGLMLKVGDLKPPLLNKRSAADEELAGRRQRGATTAHACLTRVEAMVHAEGGEGPLLLCGPEGGGGARRASGGGGGGGGSQGRFLHRV